VGNKEERSSDAWRSQEEKSNTSWECDVTVHRQLHPRSTHYVCASKCSQNGLKYAIFFRPQILGLGAEAYKKAPWNPPLRQSFNLPTHFEGQVMGICTSKPDLLDLHHVPTPEDLFTVRRYLLAKVPAELANIILDEAFYWPKVSYSLPEGGECIVRARSSENCDASVFCLLTPRLNEWIITNEAPSRKIKAVCFTIVSHDQAWASENDFPGTFEFKL